MKEDLDRLEINLKKIRSNKISLEAVEELPVEQPGKKQKIKRNKIFIDFPYIV